jgi:hypothetical protein
VSKFLFLLKILDLFFAFFYLGFFFGGGVGILVIGVINGIYGLFWFIVFLRIL